MQLHLTQWIRGGALSAALGVASATMAATPYDWTGAAGDNNYNNSANWIVGTDVFGPPWGEFNESGYIGGGATVRVTDTPGPFGQLYIAEDAGDTASLIIENGGNLVYYTGPNDATNDVGGGIDVGWNGVGTLRVQPGGSLTSGYIILRGTGSQVIIDGSGANAANVTLSNLPGKSSGFAITNGTSVRTIGPNANILSNTFDQTAGGTYIAEITGPSHSTFKTPNSAIANGDLKIEFNGYTPVVGDSWNLIDAPGFSSTFANIEVPNLALPLGQGLYFKTVADPSSQFGQFGQLALEQRLVLKVNRTTNQMSIVTGQVPVAIDGYSITSTLGGINPTNWQSLDDLNVGQWRESPVNGSANAISELEPSGTRNITTGAPLNLGSVFKLPTATSIGQELEDIQFQYYMPDGSVVQAEVIYEGEKHYNDVVLFVDPVDGDAYIQHQSTVGVAIDGYNIHSDSGSLLTGNANWNSLDDQNSASWTESGATANNLTELRSGGATALALGTSLDLGSPFKTVANGGTQDLVFSYLVDGASQFVEGVVVYKEFELTEADGDYNGDGIVNLADYTVWRDNLGATVPSGTGADGNNDGTVNAGDYAVWKSNFGQSAGAVSAMTSPSSVPEPSTCASLGVLLVGMLARQHYRRG
jgi:hypothetical protein